MPTPKEALDELLQMSSSVRHAILARGDSEVLASTMAGETGAASMLSQTRAMIDAARMSADEMGRTPLTQIFVEAKSGCVFIALGEKDTWLAATTGIDPTVGLVLYDVNTALRTALEGESAEGSK
ncbi:MAG: roadblock/LC7 domain-containing protein [Thermoleophilia bacterium]